MLNDPFFWRALLAGLGIAALAAPFGCFMVWRRMAYFGDGLAHSALLGVVLAALFSLSSFVGVLGIGLCVAALLARAERRGRLGHDALLGILAHGTLAAGLVAAAWLPGGGTALMGWLLGDILAVSWSDVAVIWGGGAVALTGLALIWRPLLFMTVDEDMARAEGHRVERIRLMQMLLMALAVAIMIKIVGVLLVTALLITPAATARRFARTPEQMVLLAAMFGCGAVIVGLSLSWFYDLATGPAMVLAAVGLFIVSSLLPVRE